MPSPRFDLARLMSELKDSFPSKMHDPEGFVQLDFTHEEARDLFDELVELINQRNIAMKRALVLSFLLESASPQTISALISLKFIDRVPVAPYKGDGTEFHFDLP
jgi:hypothetical protein